MAAQKLKISEIIVLNSELINLNREVELTFLLKYNLVKLQEQTKDIVRRFNKSKLDLFEKYGVCTDEKTKAYTLEGAEKYDVAIKELESLLDNTESLKATFKLNEFKEMKTEQPYFMIMKFLTE